MRFIAHKRITMCNKQAYFAHRVIDALYQHYHSTSVDPPSTLPAPRTALLALSQSSQRPRTIITVSLTAPPSKYVSSLEDRSGAQG